MEKIPKIERVAPIGDAELFVRFENGIEKTYDCRPVLALPEFHLLKIPAFFRAVQVDTGGHGVFWNNDLDLSEYELWTNGRQNASPAEPPA
ncbi:MAG: DUF2442 domain-containing protein [Verrucomicrobia bacterium]|nr:DUF2442 domain-containing protein [Verrucomicrobiota bacterium]